MDIVFDCPNCNQELAVDSSGAGSEIECPSCHETITIPEKSTKTASENPSGGTIVTSQAVNAISSSAAAKVEKHLKVPLREAPTEILVKKSAMPLIAVAKGADKKLRINTIRRASCIESGHDKFDERVSEFLAEVGEANIIGVHTISYSHVDVGSQKLLVDYGVMIVYRG